MQKVSNVPQKLSRAWLLRNRNTTELFTFWFSADFSSSSFQNFVKLGHLVYFFMLHPNMITGSNYWLVLENRKCNFRKSKNRLRHFFLIFCTDFAPVVRFSLAITVLPGTRNCPSRPLWSYFLLRTLESILTTLCIWSQTFTVLYLRWTVSCWQKNFGAHYGLPISGGLGILNINM